MVQPTISESLQQSLSSSNAPIRRDAVASLVYLYTSGGSSDPEIKALLDGIAHYDLDDQVREIAGTALGWDPRLIKAIAGVFMPSDRATRLEAVTALTYFMSEGSEVEVLLAHEWLARLAHHEEDEQVRQAASQALPKTGDPKAPGFSERELSEAARREPVARRKMVPWMVGLFAIGIAAGVGVFFMIGRMSALARPPQLTCTNRFKPLSAGGSSVMFQPSSSPGKRTVLSMDNRSVGVIDGIPEADSLDLASDEIHVVESRYEHVYPYFFIYSWTRSNFAQWNERMLTYGQYPSWSPDMKKIAFFRSYGYDRSSLFVMNADGSDIQPVLRTRVVSSPASWSPDGTMLAVSTPPDDGVSSNLIVINLADKSTKVLVGSGLSADYPAWSPDGKTIVYVSHDIYAINADGSDRRNLTDNAVQSITAVDWAPDSKSIVFVGQRASEPGQAIYLMDSDGKGLHTIYEGCSG